MSIADYYLPGRNHIHECTCGTYVCTNRNCQEPYLQECPFCAGEEEINEDDDW